MRRSASARACIRARVSSVLQSSIRTISYVRLASTAARIDCTVGATLSSSLKHGTTKQIQGRSVIRLSTDTSAQPPQLVAVAVGATGSGQSGSRFCHMVPPLITTDLVWRRRCRACRGLAFAVSQPNDAPRQGHNEDAQAEYDGREKRLLGTDAEGRQGDDDTRFAQTPAADGDRQPGTPEGPR